MEQSLGTLGCFSTQSWRQWFRETVDNLMSNDQFHQEIVSRAKAKAGLDMLSHASAPGATSAPPTRRKAERYVIDFGEEQHYPEDDDYEDEEEYEEAEEVDYAEEEYEEDDEYVEEEERYVEPGHTNTYRKQDHRDYYEDETHYEEEEEEEEEEGYYEGEEHYDEEQETLGAYKERMRSKRSR